MTICLERVHAVIVEKRLHHPGDPELDRHIANSAVKPALAAGRLAKYAESAQIDGAIALAIAAERRRISPPRRLPRVDLNTPQLRNDHRRDVFTRAAVHEYAHRAERGPPRSTAQ